MKEGPALPDFDYKEGCLTLIPALPDFHDCESQALLDPVWRENWHVSQTMLNSLYSQSQHDFQKVVVLVTRV